MTKNQTKCLALIERLTDAADEMLALLSFDDLDSADTTPMGWRSIGTDHDEPFTDADRDWFRRPLGGSL